MEPGTVTISAPSAAADGLARGLVEARLAACVQIVPAMRSVYRWRGELCEDDEALLLLKTDHGRLKAIEAYLEANHPYEVPELVFQPITGGSRAYLDWMEGQLRE